MKDTQIQDGDSASRLTLLGEKGICFADLSGYTQVLYQCVEADDRMRKLAMAMGRLFDFAADEHPDVSVESYAGDGFLALVGGRSPVRTMYEFAIALRERFDRSSHSLLADLGFRVNVTLRIGLHVGQIWTVRLHGGRDVKISDAINVASRVVTSQACRRGGLAVTRACYRRLLRTGSESIRPADEVILDRNQYPEPIDIYGIHPDEHEWIIARNQKDAGG